MGLKALVVYSMNSSGIPVRILHSHQKNQITVEFSRKGNVHSFFKQCLHDLHFSQNKVLSRNLPQLTLAKVPCFDTTEYRAQHCFKKMNGL